MAPTIGTSPSASSTGSVAAGLSARNSLRRVHGFSSISASSSPYSPKARRTNRQAASIGWWKSVSMVLRAYRGTGHRPARAAMILAARDQRAVEAPRPIGAVPRRDKQAPAGSAVTRNPDKVTMASQTIVDALAARPARGADRVHSGLLDRPPPARRPFPRLRIRPARPSRC